MSKRLVWGLPLPDFALVIRSIFSQPVSRVEVQPANHCRLFVRTCVLGVFANLWDRIIWLGSMLPKTTPYPIDSRQTGQVAPVLPSTFGVTSVFINQALMLQDLRLGSQLHLRGVHLRWA